MADGNVDTVRRVYEAWNAQGLEALGPWLAEAIELHDPPEMPDAGSWRGREAVLGRLDEVASAIGGSRVDLTQFRGFGDEVLVSMVWRSADAAGSADFGQVFHLVRIAHDKIVELRVFLEEAAALEALQP